MGLFYCRYGKRVHKGIKSNLTWKNSADMSKKGHSKSSSYTDLPSRPRIISIWQAFLMAPLQLMAERKQTKTLSCIRLSDSFKISGYVSGEGAQELTCLQLPPFFPAQSCPATSVVGGPECSRSVPPGPWIWLGRGCIHSPRCFAEHKPYPKRELEKKRHNDFAQF